MRRILVVGIGKCQRAVGQIPKIRTLIPVIQHYSADIASVTTFEVRLPVVRSSWPNGRAVFIGAGVDVSVHGLTRSICTQGRCAVYVEVA